MLELGHERTALIKPCFAPPGGPSCADLQVRVKQPIVGYHRDEEGHWVARLACGHSQHVRHAPPWQERPWVITAHGRRAHLGNLLECLKCDRGAPQDW